MLRRQKNNQKAQVFIEYTIVVGVVVLVLLAMNVAIKRGTQAMVKVVADEVGVQADADQRFDRDTGHLVFSHTDTSSTMDKTKNEFVGETVYRYYDETVSTTSSFTNLGFTEDN